MKTCNDLTCPVGEKEKSNPTQPTAGNNPTAADCCEDISGMCSGNKVPGNDVTCTTGYKNKANKATITGTTVSACCDMKTCNDLTCPVGKKEKSNPTQPTAGNNPTAADCCEDVTGMCTGNAISTENVNCPGGFSNLGPNTAYDTVNDDTNAKKYAKCCMQPKCLKNAAAVSASCQNIPVPLVLGTCNLAQFYTENANIESLPANPTDWSSPGTVKNVAVGSNHVDCCTPTEGKCNGNSNSANNFNCGTGYKHKANSATITGTTVSVCCDMKTCNDLTCPVGEKEKSNPTQPTAGNNPTAADCCEDISGMCSGNKVPGNDVTCTTGYKNKANKATITGTTVSACCDMKTCNDLTCPAGRIKQSDPTQPTAGTEPTAANCCGPVLGTCMSYETENAPFTCPDTHYVKELHVASVTAVAAVDCPNNAFDTTEVTGVDGQGPVCPTNTGTASPAIRSTNTYVWHCIIANFAVMLTWCYNVL